MKRALIDVRDNTVVQVEPLGGDFPISPDYAWVDCPDEVIAYSWTYDGAAFSPPPGPTLAEAKAAKTADIERDRDAACVADVTAHGRPWQADTRSQALLGQAITLASAGLPLPPVWRDADNNDMAIAGLADLLAIAGAIAAQVQVAYATGWTRKAALAAAETIEDVGAV